MPPLFWCKSVSAGRGKILLRFGHRPKVAIPFQTDTPFKKISVPTDRA